METGKQTEKYSYTQEEKAVSRHCPYRNLGSPVMIFLSKTIKPINVIWSKT